MAYIKVTYEMITVSHLVACSVVFILLCDIGRQGRVLTLMENAQFKVFLAIWVLSLKFMGRLKSGLYKIGVALNDKSATYSCVPNGFSFLEN